jgi:putative ABC transport system permease protein
VLERFFEEGLALGSAQAAAVSVLVLITVLAGRRWGVHLEREIAVAMIRGLVQIVVVGSILVLLLQSPQWTSVLVLVGMTFAGATIAARRARGTPGAFAISLSGIACGSGVVIASMTFLGVIETGISSLVPVGSMIIASTMQTSSQALERFVSEVTGDTGVVETKLALGVAPAVVVLPYVQTAVEASLIPRIDSLSSLGIVWIPGLMAGMVLAGTDPVYAAVYQFAVIAMILAASGLTSLVTTLLIRMRAFSAAEQLVLRAEAG